MALSGAPHAQYPDRHTMGPRRMPTGTGQGAAFVVAPSGASCWLKRPRRSSRPMPLRAHYQRGMPLRAHYKRDAACLFGRTASPVPHVLTGTRRRQQLAVDKLCVIFYKNSALTVPSHSIPFSALPWLLAHACSGCRCSSLGSGSYDCGEYFLANDPRAHGGDGPVGLVTMVEIQMSGAAMPCRGNTQSRGRLSPAAIGCFCCRGPRPALR